jgi:ABC-2 type transport system permease protein
VSADTLADEPLREPGKSKGLLEIPKWHYLLKLLVRKEIRVRYRGSVLGMLWTYVKPATQLIVYYIAMGEFLQLNRGVTNYVVYLFSGIVVVNFFNEVLSNTTHSIVWNAPLVGKIYLPRELFPVASLWVAFVHMVPQIVVLAIGAVIFGWRPGLSNIGIGIMGLLIVASAALGLGLMFAAWNVLFRDAENFVDLIAMVAIWVSPVFYRWEMVQSVLPGWLWRIYQANPLAVAVECFHYAFWVPTRGIDAAAAAAAMPSLWQEWTLIGLGISVVLVILGQVVFKHHESVFAQEL